MSDEDALRQLFREPPLEIADDGFTKHVMQRVDRLRRRRRYVIGGAGAAGAVVAVPALLHATQAFAASAPWAHLAGASAINVVALCLVAATVWLVTVGVEA
jgi:hypothetical protein